MVLNAADGAGARLPLLGAGILPGGPEVPTRT